MAAITGEWQKALAPEFRKPYYRALYEAVKREYSAGEVYPPAADLFTAFELTPLPDVRVVILGQDPYHEPGQAHGLCFSVRPGVEIPPSLENIFRELQDDLGLPVENVSISPGTDLSEIVALPPALTLICALSMEAS